VFEVSAPPADAGAPAPATAAATASTPAPTPQPGLAPAPQPAPAPQAAPTPAPEPQPAEAPAPEQPGPAPAAAPAPTPAPAPAPPPAPAATAAAAPRPPSPFGSSDPAAKARRLARALVSDIVTYFPDRRERALADGTLRREFTEEIHKSWQEYTAQVGDDMAKKTPFFREALNDILAKGQQVF